MWTKIVVAVATEKKRGKIIGLVVGIVGLLVIIPAVGFVVIILAPVLVVVAFFTSFFGTGINAPIHPLQAIGTNVGCVTNVFDLNTIDSIEKSLFTYDYDDQELLLKKQHEENFPDIPFYSARQTRNIEERYKKYYFDSIEVKFEELKDNPKLCGMRVLTDVLEDIKKDNPKITDSNINDLVSEIKDNKIKNFAHVVNPEDLRSSKYGLSAPFPNYNYFPSTKGSWGNSDEMYKWHSDVDNTHRGMDYPISMGTEIYALMDGIVVATDNSRVDGIYANGTYVEGFDSPLGNYVSINSRFPGDDTENSNSFINHMYLHLQQGKVIVKSGDKVLKGDLIGYSGNSGKSTGPHLDFRVKLTSPEMRIKEELINPYSVTLHDLFMDGDYKEIEKEN